MAAIHSKTKQRFSTMNISACNLIFLCIKTRAIQRNFIRTKQPKTFLLPKNYLNIKHYTKQILCPVYCLSIHFLKLCFDMISSRFTRSCAGCVDVAVHNCALHLTERPSCFYMLLMKRAQDKHLDCLLALTK